MSRVKSSPSVLDSLIAVTWVLVAGNATMACLNEYKKTPDPPFHPSYEEALTYSDSLTSGWKGTPTADELAAMKRDAKEGDFRAKTNYAVMLVRAHDAPQAIGILNAVESEHPGEYIVAANLGTAYELAGDNQQALQWITTGWLRNPDSHEQSEWLHIKILEAKIALAADEHWLDSHSVLGLDFGTDDQPHRPTATVTDFDGHAKTLQQARAALEYQLHERLAFVKPTDAIVADLLADLGNLLALEGKLKPAGWVYASSNIYAPQDSDLVRRRDDWVYRAIGKSTKRSRLAVLLLSSSALMAAVAVGLYWKQFRRKPSSSAKMSGLAG